MFIDNLVEIEKYSGLYRTTHGLWQDDEGSELLIKNKFVVM